MARKITSLKFIELIGEGKSDFGTQKLTEVEASVRYFGAYYAKAIADAINETDSVSSGKGADSISPTGLRSNGAKLEIDVEGLRYLEYVDKGVDGWAKSKGGKYRFKTKGVDPKGEMFKSILEYIKREKGFTAATHIAGRKADPIFKKEFSRKKIKDATLTRAISVSYMIKRQGIAPANFIKEATESLRKIMAKELGEALKYDIITNLG